MLLQIAFKMCCVRSARSEMSLATSTWWGFMKSDEFNLASLEIFSCVQTLNLLMKKGLGRTHLPAGLPGSTSVGGQHWKNNSAEYSYSVWAQMWSKYKACCSHYGSWCWACNSRQGFHSCKLYKFSLRLKHSILQGSSLNRKVNNSK